MAGLLGDICLNVENGSLHFGNSRIELRFDAGSGRFTGITGKYGDVRITPEQAGFPAVVLRVGGRPADDGLIRNGRRLNIDDAREIGNHSVFTGYAARCEGSRVSLELTSFEEEWEIVSIFSMEEGGDTIRRDMRLHYLGEREAVLRDVRWNLPVACISSPDACFVQAPDYPVVTDFPLNDIPYGLWSALDSENATDTGRNQHGADTPGSLAGLVGLSSEKEPVCLMAWAFTATETSLMEACRMGSGIAFSQLHLLSDRFEQGKTLKAGSQYIRLVRGDWQAAMDSFQRWYDEEGLSPPSDGPEWMNGAAIYEVHVGNAPFIGGISYEPYPCMGDLTRDLPRIKSLGFEVLQLMPHWPYCGYTVFRYEDIGVQYGNEAEFRAMVSLAHAMGMKVILDIVMHGPSDREIVRMDMQRFGSRYDFIFSQWLKMADEQSIYRREHPDWFMLDEEGQCAHTYTWAFDHAHPGFQRYFISMLKWYLQEFGVDGFRFDAPNWNSMPNWRRDLQDRASSSYYASCTLLARARKEIRADFPGTLLFTEPSGPLFRHIMDCTYNYDEEWLTGSLFTPVSPRGYAGTATRAGNRITARQAGRWLHFKNLALQGNAMTVHHLDSHDTFWWGELAQFRREAFGPEAAAAMFAVFALIGGGILCYAGAEKGSEEFYAGLLQLRQNMPELRFGGCDFLSAICEDDGVMTFLRGCGRSSVLVAVNLKNAGIQTSISFPADQAFLEPDSRFFIITLFGGNGEKTKESCPSLLEGKMALSLELPPYGVMIMKICAGQP